MQLNYALDRNDYTWTNALCWGNCFKHLEKARAEDSYGHGLIGALELLPIVGQIISIFEKIVVECLRGEENIPVLTDKEIAIGAPANDPVPPFAAFAIQPRTIADMFNWFRALPGCSLFNEDQEQVEIALNGERMGPDNLYSPWKLQVSATAENATEVFKVIFGDLIRQQPHFSCARSEQLLKDRTFITIYAPHANEQDMLKWASQINASLEDAIADGRLQRNTSGSTVHHTDRPLGLSGFLWAHNDRAAAPVANQGLAIADQPDIFAEDWGRVAWSPTQHRFLPVQ